MVIPVHAQVRVGGQLYGDALWSVSIRVAYDGGVDPFSRSDTDETPQDLLEHWVDTVKGLNGGLIMPAGLTGITSQHTVIQYVRAARIGPDGKESAVAMASGLSIAEGGASQHSAQTALVLSLQSARPGASYRGRMYLPAIGAPLGANGRLTATTCAAVASAGSSWIKDVANAFPNGNGVAGQGVHRPYVLSTKQGVLSNIVSVRVGDRLDTQRGRAEAEKEGYSASAVAQ